MIFNPRYFRDTFSTINGGLTPTSFAAFFEEKAKIVDG